MTVALVQATRVTRIFGSGHQAVEAVRDVDCSVAPGDQIALVGPSGSGKTTLLHLLAGLDHATGGRIEWPALGTLEQLRPGRVGVVFQAPSLLPPLDVVENVELPLLLAGVEPALARARAVAAITRLGLVDVAAKLPDELSGGQAQRVAIARVLADRPKLILADEPTGQLDHHNGTVVIDALMATAADVGAALVVNTHDLAVAARFPTRWAMAGGRLVTVAMT